MGVRIVGGTLARRVLSVPRGSSARPTPDRVRESLFSSLGPIWAGRAVLDLFAGSGCLGVEALSRGAASVTFVERDRRTAAAIARSLDQLGVRDRTRLLKVDAARALRLLAREGARYDAVFLDPPYDGPLLAWALEELPRSGLLADDALIVAEHPTKAEFPPCPFDVHDRRTYGDTTVSILYPPEEDET